MAATTCYNGWDHKSWDAAGLKDYGDFAECVTYCNQREDYCDSSRGDWYYCDDDTKTVYTGTFGNDHSPGSDYSTNAEVFEDEDEYTRAVAELDAMPEYLEDEGN